MHGVIPRAAGSNPASSASISSFPKISAQSIYKNFGKIKALQAVSFSIHKGELFALLGPNGAGKTTLIKILAGIIPPDKGQVLIDGKDFFKDISTFKKEIGVVPQTINLEPELSLEENLLIHGLIYRMSLKKIKQRIKEVLLFADLLERKKDKVKHLSGGMKRRLLIARALMHEPSILLLDEPTVGLDPQIRRKLWELIKKIQLKGATILLTTHYMEEAEQLADKVAFIHKGKLIVIDTPSNLISSLGQYAIDIYTKEKRTTKYFHSREKAEKELLLYSKENALVTLRRITLEDVFFKYIGSEL